ncbi:hypothetical protein [Gluconobacter japonicus]|uniref:Uncharacterized protein n=1 Tax=Gluconobacter japonicus TaxID=376620 RepID=A0A9Q2FNG9_GLUJA|nr:hypothetical protein [Gluconobacter japonicus]MBF0872123.1 hypothetical protein [Gluconobacter japonicus]
MDPLMQGLLVMLLPAAGLTIGLGLVTGPVMTRLAQYRVMSLKGTQQTDPSNSL